MPETMEHRVIRSKRLKQTALITEMDMPMAKHQATGEMINKAKLLPEFEFIQRPPTKYECEPLPMPRFLYGLGAKVQATKRRM